MRPAKALAGLTLAIIVLYGIGCTFDIDGEGNGEGAEKRERLAQPIAFPETGRLRIDARDLPEEETIRFAIPLEPEARGRSPRPVFLSSGDGRHLEITGALAAEPESGVRISIERGFLEPGVYLVQIRTAEVSPLPVRRFVLEVE